MNLSVTAIHEAGHAFGYWRSGLPLRYVTVRPAAPGLAGVCRPWRPRRVDSATLAFVAALGPIAEAIHVRQHDEDTDPFVGWSDYVSGAVLDAGHGDFQTAGHLLDEPSASLLRDELIAAWHRVERLSERLEACGTVRGADAWHLLGTEA